jgi:hypothetical protein
MLAAELDLPGGLSLLTVFRRFRTPKTNFAQTKNEQTQTLKADSISACNLGFWTKGGWILVCEKWM